MPYEKPQVPIPSVIKIRLGVIPSLEDWGQTFMRRRLRGLRGRQSFPGVNIAKAVGVHVNEKSRGEKREKASSSRAFEENVEKERGLKHWPFQYFSF